MTKLRPVYVKSGIPEGRSGRWVVEKFSLPRFEREDPSLPDWAKRRPGRYTRLKCGNEIFMTDLYDEWWTQRSAAFEACKRGGHVLITGLGLGLIIESILRTPDCPVEKVTVVEMSSDVIRLVGSHLQNRYRGRIEVIEQSAFCYRPPAVQRYSVIWHDIWPNPHAEKVIEEAEQLCRRYQRFCDWQGAWPIEYRAAEQSSAAAH